MVVDAVPLGSRAMGGGYHHSAQQAGCVISMGGYVALPGGLMGVMMGKPLVVHEPGAHAGLTNRVLGLLLRARWWGFRKRLIKCRRMRWRGCCRNQARRLAGYMVRADIAAIAAPDARLKRSYRSLRLLIVGGSLGAKRSMNSSWPRWSAMDCTTRPKSYINPGKPISMNSCVRIARRTWTPRCCPSSTTWPRACNGAI